MPPRSVMAMLVLLGGCATQPPAGVPDDFQLNVAIWRQMPLVPEPADDTTAAPVVPGRYVLLPGGALHWSPDGDPSRGLPPRRRVLSIDEVAGLWAQLESLGLADPQRGTPPTNLRLAEPIEEDLTTLAVVTGHHRSWQFRDRADAAPLVDLAGHLERLAWARPPSGPEASPRRYDFGPDPYARYRR